MLIFGIVVMVVFIIWQIHYPVYSQVKEEEVKMEKLKTSLDKSVGPRNYILVSFSDTRENEFARKISNKVIYNETPVVKILNGESIDWGILSGEEKEILDNAIDKSYLKGISVKKAVRAFDDRDINVYHKPPGEAHYLEPYKD